MAPTWWLRVPSLVLCLVGLWVLQVHSASIVLTDADFHATTTTGKWLILFCAPWNGHCKQLQGTWREASLSLEGRVHMAEVCGKCRAVWKEVFAFFFVPMIGEAPLTKTQQEQLLRHGGYFSYVMPSIYLAFGHTKGHPRPPWQDRGQRWQMQSH